MCFEKGVDLETGPVAEQAAKFAGREFFLAIGLEGNGFEGSPFDIARGGEEAGEIVGEIEGEAGHGNSIGDRGQNATRNEQPTPN